MVYYHGSNMRFDKLNIDYGLDGFIYISPCRNMSLSYTTRTGGYLYTIEVDESNTDFHLSYEYGSTKCLCRAYHSVDGLKIIKVERIEYSGKAMLETECGSYVSIFNRSGGD